MRTLLTAAAVLLVLPAASHAQVDISARLGYARPAGGRVTADVGGFAVSEKLSDFVDSQVPLQVDAAYRLTRELAVGAYLAYGFAQLSSEACPAPLSDCSARDLRVGVQGIFTLARLETPWIPWVSLGAGWERLSYDASASAGFGLSVTGHATFTGWEYLNVQLGADWRAGPRLSVGPWIGWSIGKLSDATVEIPGSGDFDRSIPDASTHQWYGLGVRGKLDL